MRTIQEIVEEAKRLTILERRRLIAELQQALPMEEASKAETRLAALDAWIARAGSGQSAFTNVARDKYKHLAETYADKHEKVR